MTEEEKEKFIDNIPDYYLHLLYAVLFNNKIRKIVEEGNAVPNFRSRNKIIMENGEIYYVWEDQ